MAKIFTLSWTPGASASSQTVQYRVKNTGSWVDNANITAANPQSAGTTSATISGLSNNVIYQFQVLSNCCPGTQAAGAVLEGIIFADLVATHSAVGTVISVNQTTNAPDINTITYRIADNNAPTVYLQTITATGTNPAATFASVASGSYTVTYSYTTAVNGVNVHSYDATQANAWYTTGTITV